MRSPLRRGAAAAAVLLATSTGLAACGDGDDGDAGAPPPSASASESTSESAPESADPSATTSATDSGSAGASAGAVAPAAGPEVDLDVVTARAPEGAELVSDGVSTTYSYDDVLISYFALPTPLTGDLDDIYDAALSVNDSTPPVPTRGPDRTLDGIPGVTLLGPAGDYESWYLWAGGAGQNLVTITFSSRDRNAEFDQLVESVLATVQAG